MKKQTITIENFFDIVRCNSSYFLRVILVSFILSLFYVSTKSNYYESKISLYAAGELEDGGLLSQYSSIADNLGISTMTPSANYYIPDIVDSRSLKEELVNKKWNNLKFSEPKNLVEYWQIDEKGFLTKFLLKESSLLGGKILYPSELIFAEIFLATNAPKLGTTTQSWLCNNSKI